MNKDKVTRMTLQMNGEDNPSCPKCGNYNAMLTEEINVVGEPPNTHHSKCRDCSFETLGAREQGPHKLPRW